MTTPIPRINVEVTADDQSDSDLVARLIVASLNNHGFEDVTNVTTPTHSDKEEEVVEAMRTLNPALFNAEVTVEASTFDEAPGVASGEDVSSDEFPDPSTEEDEEGPDEDG